MNLFENKVAIVTGGGAGLGRALCLELSAQGAICIVADLNFEAAAGVVKSIIGSKQRACAFRVDVARADQVELLINTVRAEHGRIDYLFNNAGILLRGEVGEMDLTHWQRIIEVNLLGVIHGTSVAYRHMTKQHSGHIVNISSLSGLISLPLYTAYATTKHAVVGLSNSLRIEGRDLGVKVSVVCPGPIRTDIANAGICVGPAWQDQPKSAGLERIALDPGMAAREILHGIEQGKAVMIFPFSARLLYWIYYLCPALLDRLWLPMVRKFREVSGPEAIRGSVNGAESQSQSAD